MFSFVDAGSWFAHFICSWGAVPALSPAHRHCPSEEALGTGSPAVTCRMKRNSEPKHLAKIARWLEGRITSIKTLQLPDMRNVMHNLCETGAFWFRDDR
jgi:hypothetical protein